MRRPGIAGTLAAAVVLASAPGAGAAGGLSYEKKAFMVAPLARAEKRAPCGSRHVISGGVATPNNPTAVRVAGLAPYDTEILSGGDLGLEPDDGFRAIVENVSQNKRKFTVHAICSKGSFAYEDPIQPATSGFTTHSAGCGGGLTPLGGGVTTGAPFNTAYVVGSNPASGSWAVSFDTGFETVAYITWRICKGGWTVNEAAKTRTLLLGDRPTLRSLSCDQGQRLVGGGATGSDYNMYLLESRPVDTGDANKTPDAWQATIHNARQDGETFTVYALCRDTL